MPTQSQYPKAHAEDSARLWHANTFGGLELLRARYVEFSFAPHTHDEFMIAVTVSGTAIPYFWGRPQRLWPGDLFVLSPGEVHGGGPAGGAVWAYRAFYPPAGLMQRVLQEVAGYERGVPQFAEAIVRDPMVAAQLRQAHQTLEMPEPALAHEGALLGALASLVMRHGQGKPATSHTGAAHYAVKRVKDYLDALPGENVSLDRLAREAGISAFHLCRVFRRDTGLSPQAYQILARTRRAKALLTQGLPISEAALEAGFFDQAHLTRHFKRIFGVTPGQYQRAA